ncbi:MAG: hypothetical protein AAF699_03235 [Pseudomonadota bacterium]
MSEDRDTSNSSQLDARLAQRFAELRRSETSSTPGFRQPVLARSPRHSGSNQGQRAVFGLPRMAAAAAVVGLGVFLLIDAPKEDPAAVYAGIMQHQQMQTDWLLSVSDTVLPAQQPVPTLYDMDAAINANQDFE